MAALGQHRHNHYRLDKHAKRSRDQKSRDAAGYNDFYGNGKTGLDQFYVPLNVISQGSYGIVYRARDKKTGEIVAMKQELHGLSRSTMREMKILMSLPRHPSIVGFRKAIQDDDDRLFLVMDYLKTDLKRFRDGNRKPLNEREVMSVMKQILEGVDFLHDSGLMHRDLKPANILMNNLSELKICDFGLSRRLESESGSYTPGVVTLWYRSPELLLGEKIYSKAIDIWSVGCIMAELVLNEVIFQGKTEIHQLSCIKQTLRGPSGIGLRRKFDVAGRPPLLSPCGLDLVERLLRYDPGKRITAKDALHHNWFKKAKI